jgi:hypothetical protein
MLFSHVVWPTCPSRCCLVQRYFMSSCKSYLFFIYLIQETAGNGSTGKEVVDLLLQRDATIEITEAIVTAAAGS